MVQLPLMLDDSDRLRILTDLAGLPEDDPRPFLFQINDVKCTVAVDRPALVLFNKELDLSSVVQVPPNYPLTLNLGSVLSTPLQSKQDTSVGEILSRCPVQQVTCRTCNGSQSVVCSHCHGESVTCVCPGCGQEHYTRCESCSGSKTEPCDVCTNGVETITPAMSVSFGESKFDPILIFSLLSVFPEQPVSVETGGPMDPMRIRGADWVVMVSPLDMTPEAV